MNTIPERSLTRKVERRLVGMVMAAIAYLLEKAVLRSIKRSGTKPPALNTPAS